LRILDGSRAGEVVLLGARNTVGRLGDNDICVPEQGVSGHHALISWQGGCWVIEDQASTNGTFVNGQRIVAATTLSEGDTISLSTSRLEIMSVIG